jgi:hypothetical protein
MTQITASNSRDTNEARLPPRDWIVLPLVGLLTICLLAGSVELIAHRLLSVSKASLNDCLVMNDTATGVRAIPNAVCHEKTAEESQPIEYDFDDCGYRSGTRCEPKPRGVYRVVVTGSSIAMGERVPFQQSIAALLPIELSAQTGRTVQLYDEAMAWGFPRNTALHFKDVLDAKPDLILWILTSRDVKDANFTIPPPPPPTLRRRAIDVVKKELGVSVANSVMRLTAGGPENPGTTAIMMLEHVLYASESGEQYVTSYLQAPEAEVGFLRAEPTPIWNVFLTNFDSQAAEIESRATKAGVPFAAVLLPNRAQAAMISMGKWPSGYNPYALDDELRAIIVSHGGTYISVLHGFRGIPNPEQYYFPVDGHPFAPAHAIFARLIAEQLISGAVPALRVPSLQASY